MSPTIDRARDMSRHHPWLDRQSRVEIARLANYAEDLMRENIQLRYELRHAHLSLWARITRRIFR